MMSKTPERPLESQLGKCVCPGAHSLTLGHQDSGVQGHLPLA